jgi:hypothetical protein
MFVGEKRKEVKGFGLVLFLFLCFFFLSFFLWHFLPVLFFVFFPFFLFFFVGVALHVFILQISLKALLRVYMRFVSGRGGLGGFIDENVVVLLFFFAL